MAQAIANPEALERFAHSLRQFVESLNDAASALSHEFAVLGDTWQDGKRAQFEEDYRALIQHLQQFDSSASEHIPYLHLLASRLRDYLQS